MMRSLRHGSSYTDMLVTFTCHFVRLGQYGTGPRVIELTNCILTAASSCSGRVFQTGYPTFQQVPSKGDEAQRNRDGQGAAVGLRKVIYEI
jgi:hypothetical protein